MSWLAWIAHVIGVWLLAAMIFACLWALVGLNMNRQQKHRGASNGEDTKNDRDSTSA